MYKDWTIGRAGVDPEGVVPEGKFPSACWAFRFASWASRSKIRCWLVGSGATAVGSHDCICWATSRAIC